jgi:hypothetical protein
VGEPGKDDGEFLMQFSVFGDGLVEGAEILVRERIEDRGMAHFVEGALHRAAPFDDFASELQDDAAVPVRSPASTQPIN